MEVVPGGGSKERKGKKEVKFTPRPDALVSQLGNVPRRWETGLTLSHTSNQCDYKGWSASAQARVLGEHERRRRARVPPPSPPLAAQPTHLIATGASLSPPARVGGGHRGSRGVLDALAGRRARASETTVAMSHREQVVSRERPALGAPGCDV